MATGKSKSTFAKFKCLATLTLGGNEIRFVGMNEETNGVHFPQVVNHCPGRLLFVASDVMRGSKVTRKNFTRVITRFSKIGLAVKLRLSGFKIDGINNGGVIWFFSIQGLFRVAFNLGNMAFQKDCLSELQEVWLTRYNDTLLPAAGVLRFNKRFREVAQDCVLPNVKHPENIELESEARKPTGRACTSTSIVVSNESLTYQKFYKDQRNELVHTNSMCTCVGNCDCSQGFVDEEAVTDADTEKSDSDVDEDPSETNTELDSNATRQNRKFSSTDDIRQKLLHFIRTLYLDKVSNSFVSHLLLTFDYLNVFVNSQETDSLENFENVPFRIMEEFLLLVNTENDLPDVVRNTFGMSREKFILLHVISDWLGKEFHDFEGVIKENVEAFKQENITCIDSLPSAETIIKTLFPSFMRTFVTNWLGFHTDDMNLKTSEASSMADHCYTQVQRLKGEGHINYQLVQLILEFGSNCLISGIGHVVFSRLQLENNSDT